MHINDLLKVAVERKASDLHLKVSAFPVIRVDGQLIPLTDTRRLMQEDTIAMAFSIMSARQKEKFKNDLEIDIAYSVPNLGRFRCNIFQQRGTVGLVLRVIPARILTIRDLLLPPVLGMWTKLSESSHFSTSIFQFAPIWYEFCPGTMRIPSLD